MHIESDRPTGVENPDVWMETTAEDNRHAATALDYETVRLDEQGNAHIKCYDADGTSVMIHLSRELLDEILLEIMWAIPSSRK